MKTGINQEQRSTTREWIEVPLKIVTLNNNSEGEEYPGKTIDVSDGGFGLQSAVTVNIQDDVMCIVNMGENEDPEYLFGKVIWQKKGENENRYGLKLKHKGGWSFPAFLNKVRLRANSYKKNPTRRNQIISDESILKVHQYLNASSIQLHQIQKLNSSYVHKVNDEQVWISDVRNADEYAWEVDELRPYTLFYTYAYPNLNCPVCFDHQLDHYPMMSLFEMTRQMGLAIMHQFYHVPMKGYISVAQKLSFDYRVFAELDFPLVIYMVDMCEPVFVNKVQNRIVELYFVQENVICACVQGEMSALKSEMYLRIRKSARKNKLAGRFGNTSEVELVTNVDVAPLYASRSITQRI
ncbi:MAG TPA: AfsA-related hotdog domain-containing protein [Chitinispirillaceae bacterium]|nr:AfsA-related hotdog domain-containing protein [Chitinispirillaceae bacterium]